MTDAKRFPPLNEQRVIYDVMTDHFDSIINKGGIDAVSSPDAKDETMLFLGTFVEAGLAPAPVEVLSRLALRDALRLHAVRSLSPGDFL